MIAPVRDANLEEIRSAAEKRAREIAAKTGLVLRSVEVGRGEGNLVTIEARADFASVAVLSNAAFSVGPGPGGVPAWAFVTPREVLFRDGVFSARVLRGSAPPKGDPFRARLKGHHARFTVHLPGEVLHADGAREGSSVTWRFPLDHLCDEPAEMNARVKEQSMAGTLLLGAALLAGLAVMIASLFKKRRA